MEPEPRFTLTYTTFKFFLKMLYACDFGIVYLAFLSRSHYIERVKYMYEYEIEQKEKKKNWRKNGNKSMDKCPKKDGKIDLCQPKCFVQDNATTSVGRVFFPLHSLLSLLCDSLSARS